MAKRWNMVRLALPARRRSSGWVTIAVMASVATVTTNQGFLRRVAADSGYVLAGFPIALVSHILLVTGMALSIGLLPLFGLGIFVGAGTMLLARIFADLERLWLKPSWRKRPLYQSSDGSLWKRTLRILGDVQSWLDWVHGVFALIIS